jgi:hypothetical protein
VQAPGGVDDHHVGAAGAGGGDRVEGDRAGVAALLGADQFGARPVRPLGELLGSGGAVGVCGSKDDRKPKFL